MLLAPASLLNFSLPLFGKTVADAWLSYEQLWQRGIAFEFFAETGEIDP